MVDKLLTEIKKKVFGPKRGKKFMDNFLKEVGLPPKFEVVM